MCQELAPRLAAAPAREEAARWCATLAGIEEIRAAAKDGAP
jgi:hypothetical protein